MCTKETHFAPAERALPEEVQATAEKIKNEQLLCELLDSVPGIVLVVNKQRQIVAANQELLNLLGVNSADIILGDRPGEAIACVHAKDGPNGCGTHPVCATCGAVLAMLASQQSSSREVRECRILIGEDQSTCLDMEFHAAPLNIAGCELTVCSLRDISSEKRRKVLERVFFHDILNTAGGVYGFADMLAQHSEMLDREEFDRAKTMLVTLAENLIQEINSQKQLLAAENGDLAVNLMPISSREIMGNATSLYQKHPVSKDRLLRIVRADDCIVETDPHLVLRVLGNIIKNALEATSSGEEVTVACHASDQQVEFRVHNNEVMPEAVKLQIFHRSFSTKGTGRGIGTYSMKLLGERYLRGKVNFTTSKEQGTEFVFCLPLKREGAVSG